MSHQATTWALNAGSEPGEQPVGDTARKFLLVAMADHAHKNGRNSWASRETLADYLECSVKTVGRHQAQLLTDGFIRRGDQSIVAHLRADRRPVVYDLAMNETTRARWQEKAATGDSSWDSEQASAGRQDDLSPRPDEHDETPLSPRDDSAGGHTTGHTGGQDPAHDGTPVSHKPMNPGTGTPQPPASRGSQAEADQTRPHVAGCPCRGLRPCRPCGTTPRQVDRDDQRAAADERRRTRDAEIQAERAHRGRILSDPAYPEKLSAAASAARVAVQGARR